MLEQLRHSDPADKALFAIFLALAGCSLAGVAAYILSK